MKADEDGSVSGSVRRARLDCASGARVCFASSDVAMVELTYTSILDSLNRMILRLRQLFSNRSHLLVGVSISESECLVPIVIGILRIQCAFVYIPPTETLSFRRRQCERLCVAAVFTDEQDECFAGDAEVAKALVEVGERTFALWTRKDCVPVADDIAYVMQTSGTTGAPKIIRVPHSCILPNIIDFEKRLEMSSADTVLLLSPLTFDPSIVEIFLALSSGANLLIVPTKLKYDLPVLVAVLMRHRPTIVQMTPSFLQLLPVEFVRAELLGADSFVRCLLLGGEPFPISFVRMNRHPNNRTRLFNVYGITEVSCWATCRELDQISLEAAEDIDLGEPMLDTTICIRDGYLWIGGAARRCFVDDEAEAAEFRCTGDLVEMDGNGRVLFVGRSDDQLKRMGMRVNLTQIEQLVNSSGLATGCAACLDAASTALVLFVRVDDARGNWRDQLSALLGADLPRHVRPTALLPISSFPVTKHGKVDKAALMRMWRASVDNSYGAAAMIRLLEDMLDRQSVTDHSATLKSLGVDSLGVVRLAAEVDRLSGTSRPLLVAQLLDAKTTVADLVRLVDRSADQADASSPVAKRPRSDSTFVDRATGQSETQINLEMSWSWNSGKCIDASPIVAQNSRGEAVAFVGSHSGRFAAIFCDDGSTKWVRQLPDRIEATCSTNDGIVAFGCFDGKVYFLSCETGEDVWEWKTDDAVKSTPIFYEQSVVVGSHDRTVYRLDYQKKRCVWSRLLDGGVLSSPCVCAVGGRSMAFVATLSSTVFALDWEDGTQVWSVPLAKPVFAHLQSLSFTDTQSALIVADVGGRISLLSCDDGVQLASYELVSSVFGAPLVVHMDEQCWRLYCGTDDGRLCCTQWTVSLSSQKRQWRWHMAVVWTKTLTAGLARSPLVFKWDRTAQKCVRYDSTCAPVNRQSDPSCALCCLAVASDGVGVLVDKEGLEMGGYRLPGACFSSPAVVDAGVVVGCRDNSLYCLRLSAARSASSRSSARHSPQMDARER